MAQAQTKRPAPKPRSELAQALQALNAQEPKRREWRIGEPF